MLASRPWATPSLLCLGLFFFLAPAALCADSWFKMPSPFTVVCKNGTCVKKERTDSTVIQSLAICKLRCGKHRVLWPQPSGEVDLSRTVVAFKPQNLKVSHLNAPNQRVKDMLTQAFKIFQGYLFKMHPENAEGRRTPFEREFDNQIESTSVFLGIDVEEPDDRITLETLEGYRLELDTQGSSVRVELRADTYFGARHGLETLSQLIAYDEQRESLQIVSSGVVTDRPAFPYRGIMLDTARNFFPLKSIKRLVDAMSYNKLNTLHWHLTDAHSFPFYSQRVPQMTLYGAYTPRKIYFPEQIRGLVEYARVRGVRVLPELNAPGHTANGWQWGSRQEGHEEMALCVNHEPWRELCSEPPCGQLNPYSDKVYEVLGKLYRDFLDVFEPHAFHMGGSDVSFSCWNDSRSVRSSIQELGRNASVPEFMQMWVRFQTRAFGELVRANRGRDIVPFLWSSRLMIQRGVENILDPERYVVQIGASLTDRRIASILERSYRVVFSIPEAWSFDCGFGADSPRSCRQFQPWQRMYDHNPLRLIQNLNVTEPVEFQASQLLGGEALMWSDLVDEMGLEPKVWPRGAAVAERLWSNPSSGWKQAEHRFLHHRQRMVERGVRADSVQPEWCYQNQGHCSTTAIKP